MTPDQPKRTRVDLSGSEHLKSLGAAVVLAIATSGGITLTTSRNISAAVDDRLGSLERTDAARSVELKTIAGAVSDLGRKIDERNAADDEYKRRLERLLGKIEATLPALERRDGR